MFISQKDCFAKMILKLWNYQDSRHLDDLQEKEEIKESYPSRKCMTEDRQQIIIMHQPEKHLHINQINIDTLATLESSSQIKVPTYRSCKLNIGEICLPMLILVNIYINILTTKYSLNDIVLMVGDFLQYHPLPTISLNNFPPFLESCQHPNFKSTLYHCVIYFHKQ